MYDDPPAAVSPGWYDDPHRRFEYRYHNGQRWTSDVSSGGQRLLDPLGVAPSPAAPHRPGPAHAGAPVPPGWVQPGPAAKQPGRTTAVLSLVFGVVAVALALVPFLFVLGAMAAVAAFVLGIVTLRRIREAGSGERWGRGRAIAGIAMAPVALLLCGVGFVFTQITIREIDDYTDPGEYVISVDRCTIDHGAASASGTITNGSAKTREYIIRIEYRDQGRVVQTHQVDVPAVLPAADAPWTDGLYLGDVTSADLTCTAGQVTGPYPFDLSPNGQADGSG